MCQEVFHFCILHWELVGRLHLCCTPYNEPCGYNWTDPFFTCDFGAGSLCTPNMSSSLLLAATFTVCFIVLISCSCFSFAFSCSCFIWLALCICSSMSWSTEAQFEHLTNKVNKASKFYSQTTKLVTRNYKKNCPEWPPVPWSKWILNLVWENCEHGHYMHTNRATHSRRCESCDGHVIWCFDSCLPIF